MPFHKFFFALFLAAGATPARANTYEEIQRIETRVEKFMTEHPRLLTKSGAPCEVKKHSRLDTRNYEIQVMISTADSTSPTFEIRGPRITPVFQSFTSELTPTRFVATVTNAASDGYGLWDTDICELEISGTSIHLSFIDILAASSRVVSCYAP